jgi:hypothetical protein
MADDVAAADALIASTLERFGADRVSPYVLGIAATRCGRQDQAFAHLERAIERRDPNVMMLGTDSSFAALRDDPRWAPLLARRKPATDD